MTKFLIGVLVGALSLSGAIVVALRPFFRAASAYWDDRRRLTDAERRIAALRGGAQ